MQRAHKPYKEIKLFSWLNIFKISLDAVDDCQECPVLQKIDLTPHQILKTEVKEILYLVLHISWVII